MEQKFFSDSVYTSQNNNYCSNCLKQQTKEDSVWFICINCNSKYCNKCQSDVINQKESCAFCNSSIRLFIIETETSKGAKEAKGAKGGRNLKNLKFKNIPCIYSYLGCKEVLAIEKILIHQCLCPFKEDEWKHVETKNSITDFQNEKIEKFLSQEINCIKCGGKFKLSMINGHQNSECVGNHVSCIHCFEIYNYDTNIKHFELFHNSKKLCNICTMMQTPSHNCWISLWEKLSEATKFFFPNIKTNISKQKRFAEKLNKLNKLNCNIQIAGIKQFFCNEMKLIDQMIQYLSEIIDQDVWSFENRKDEIIYLLSGNSKTVNFFQNDWKHDHDNEFLKHYDSMEKSIYSGHHDLKYKIRNLKNYKTEMEELVINLIKEISKSEQISKPLSKGTLNSSTTNKSPNLMNDYGSKINQEFENYFNRELNELMLKFYAMINLLFSNNILIPKLIEKVRFICNIQIKDQIMKFTFCFLQSSLMLYFLRNSELFKLDFEHVSASFVALKSFVKRIIKSGIKGVYSHLAPYSTIEQILVEMQYFFKTNEKFLTNTLYSFFNTKNGKRRIMQILNKPEYNMCNLRKSEFRKLFLETRPITTMFLKNFRESYFTYFKLNLKLKIFFIIEFTKNLLELNINIIKEITFFFHQPPEIQDTLAFRYQPKRLIYSQNIDYIAYAKNQYYKNNILLVVNPLSHVRIESPTNFYYNIEHISSIVHKHFLFCCGGVIIGKSIYGCRSLSPYDQTVNQCIIFRLNNLSLHIYFESMMNENKFKTSLVSTSKYLFSFGGRNNNKYYLNSCEFFKEENRIWIRTCNMNFNNRILCSIFLPPHDIFSLLDIKGKLFIENLNINELNKSWRIIQIKDSFLKVPKNFLTYSIALNREDILFCSVGSNEKMCIEIYRFPSFVQIFSQSFNIPKQNLAYNRIDSILCDILSNELLPRLLIRFKSNYIIHSEYNKMEDIKEISMGKFIFREISFFLIS